MTSETKAAPLEPWTAVDQYRVVRQIGEGGMGEVYLARDTSLGRLVALKLLAAALAGSPRRAQQILLEARTTAKLSHPNVVNVYGVGSYEGRPYLALEYVEGQHLGERLRQERLSLRELTGVGLAIARALAAAHELGIVHRDLKPSNVLLGVDGRPRVVDFGIAKLLGSDERFRPADTIVDETIAAPGTPRYMPPERFAGTTTTASDVWSLGVILYQAIAGRLPYPEREVEQLAAQICSPDPVPVPPAFRDVPAPLSELVLACLAKDPAQRPEALQVVAALEALDVGRRERRAESTNPFRGLLPFTEDHADLFFGRDAELTAFLEQLRQGVLLAVVGASGTGKSSFVRAGVIPRLRELANWKVIRLRPGPQPLARLAEALSSVESTTSDSFLTADDALGTLDATVPDARAAHPVEISSTPAPAGRPPSPVDVLRSLPPMLAIMLNDVAARTGSRVLLFVDQLEELLTQAEDPAERRAFVDAICSAAADPQEPIRVVLTLRDGFLGRIPWGAHGRRALANVTLLRAPDDEALRQVVLGPLERLGYRFDDETVVDEILASVRGEAACLPLLQFALGQLWERRDVAARRLRRSAFDAMGAVAGALADHADRVLDGMPEEHRGVARELLLRLVTAEGARRSAARERLVDGLPAAAGEVLDRLVGARLLSLRKGQRDAEEVMVELAHESLTTTWHRFARWIEESREELGALAQLREASELWDRRGRRPDELWAGDALRDAERTLARVAAAVPDTTRTFVAAGVARRARARRRRRLLGAALVTALALATITSTVAAWALAARARTARSGQERAELHRAEVLQWSAIAAGSARHPFEARAQLRSALEARDSLPLRALWTSLAREPLLWSHPNSAVVYDVAYSPDGRTIAVASQARSVTLFDTDALKTRSLRGHADQVLDVAFAPDGATLASSAWDGEIRLWDVRTGETVRRWQVGAGVRWIDVSPDGAWLAAGCLDGGVRLFGLRSGEVRGPFARDQRKSWGVAFSPRGERLAVGGVDGSIRVLDVDDGAERLRIDQGSPVGNVAISPDGRTIASAHEDKVVRLWDAATGALRRELLGHKGRLGGLDFSPDGVALASAGGDFELREWNAATGAVLRRYRTTDGVVGVDYHPSGDRLAISTRSGIEVIQASRGRPVDVALEPHRNAVVSVAVSRDGRLIASGNTGVRLWDAATGRLLASMAEEISDVRSVAFAASGRTLALAGTQGTVQIREVPSGTLVAQLSIEEPDLYALLYDEERDLIAVEGAGHAIVLWDLSTRRPTIELAGHTASVLRLVLAPGGAEILSVGRDGRLFAWPIAGGEGRLLLEHGAALRDVAVSLDGARVAAAAEDGEVFMIDRATGEVSTFSRTPGRLYGLALSPDGTRLAAVGSSRDVDLWSVGTRQELTVRGHGGEVNVVEFTADGARLVTGSDDQTVRVWRADDGRPVWHSPGLLGVPFREVDLSGEPGRPLREAVAEARLVSQLGGALCLATFGGRVQRWAAGAGAPGLDEALDDVERVLATEGGCLTVSSGVARLHGRGAAGPRVVARDVTAVARASDRVLVASGEALLAFDGAGRRLERRELPPGVTALLEVGRDQVILGFAEGAVTRCPAVDLDRGCLELRDTPAAGARTLAAGPAGTVVAGFEDGTVGLWDVASGRRLSATALHGPIVDVAREPGRLVVVSALGASGEIDTSALELPYCQLLRQVWQAIPFSWSHDGPVRSPRPSGHRCAP